VQAAVRPGPPGPRRRERDARRGRASRRHLQPRAAGGHYQQTAAGGEEGAETVEGSPVLPDETQEAGIVQAEASPGEAQGDSSSELAIAQQPTRIRSMSQEPGRRRSTQQSTNSKDSPA
ncbi:hypothetical protein THAOC_02013, partial [Thalassiosira oceanica]